MARETGQEVEELMDMTRLTFQSDPVSDAAMKVGRIRVAVLLTPEALDVDPADAAAPQEKTLGGCFHRECRPGPVDSLKAQAAVTDFVMGDS